MEQATRDDSYGHAHPTRTPRCCSPLQGCSRAKTPEATRAGTSQAPQNNSQDWQGPQARCTQATQGTKERHRKETQLQTPSLNTHTFFFLFRKGKSINHSKTQTRLCVEHAKTSREQTLLPQVMARLGSSATHYESNTTCECKRTRRNSCNGCDSHRQQTAPRTSAS